MPMPSVTDLQTMYGSWNPQAYLTAQDNAGLERQFRESEYGRQQELTKQAGLDTVFKQQDDPNRVQERILTNRQKTLTNTGLEQSNESAGLKLEREKAMQKYNLDADQRKALMQVTDDELKQADQVIEQLRRSLNPEDQKRGQQLYEFTGAARALKQKHADEMEKIKYPQQQETGRMLERFQHELALEDKRQTGQNTRAAMPRGSSIPKPPNTPIAQYLADLRQAYADNKIDEETYNRSVAQAVNAELAAKTAGRTGGIELAIPPGGGSPQLAPKAPAPALAPIGENAPATPKPPVTKLSELQKMYPGKSDAELRAAYKKKFGVDLQ